jgi:hypothetical protein
MEATGWPGFSPQKIKQNNYPFAFAVSMGEGGPEAAASALHRILRLN